MRRDGANIVAGDRPASLDKKHRSAKLGHALRLREVKARALQLVEADIALRLVRSN